MRKILLALLLLGTLTNCKKDSTAQSSSGSSNCGTYKSGQTLFIGPQGGCYYITSGGNKEYVDRSYCKCSAR